MALPNKGSSSFSLWLSLGRFSKASSSSGNDESDNASLMHKKRLAMILRYIATMHHSAADSDNYGFVRCDEHQTGMRALQQCHYLQAPPQGEQQHDDGVVVGDKSQVLFSTFDFSRLLTFGNDLSTLFSSPPFSFYAAGDSIPKKRPASLAGTLKDSITILSSSHKNIKSDDRGCWLRLTRLAKKETPPSVTSLVVKEYLMHWKARTNSTSLQALLTLRNLQNAPKIGPGQAVGRVEIKLFLRRYRKYLTRNQVRKRLEPMYNRLFEHLQQGTTSHEELVWGFGNAKLVIRENETAGSYTIINGPLLEVLVEVELARDGALLVRPRQHTGVALNRQVTMAILRQEGSRDVVLSSLYKSVSEMETTQLSPGQPTTYAPLLKRIALQLSPNGTFVSSSQVNKHNSTQEGLLVTDAWCLYCRPKPSTVWARDASVLADQLLLQSNSVATRNNDNDDLLPKATWALTHGPGVLQETDSYVAQEEPYPSGVFESIATVLLRNPKQEEPSNHDAPPLKPLFALPTSDSQELIAELLLDRNAPAVVCEGPPGTGKTHTIANIVCAYLCQGKRVCVTSKGAPALSVLRQRLPLCVQELCVDVSMSESMGMRQLQQTVERLAYRVSCVNSTVQTEKCRLLRQNIDELEEELRTIDDQLESHSEAKGRLLTSPDGQELAENALSLVSIVPWFIKTLANWTLVEMKSFQQRVESIMKQQDGESIDLVSGYEAPPAEAFISRVAANAGATLSIAKTAALNTVASVPVLGSISGLIQKQADFEAKMEALRVHGSPPQTKGDWQLALAALNHSRDLHKFHLEALDSLITREKWPVDEIYTEHEGKRRISKEFSDILGRAVHWKELACKLGADEAIQESLECARLDSRRTHITERIQLLAENMVEATVVTELRRTFSVEAQSALIKFAQVAGKSKFSKASQPSKMSQRQRRHRQEYLEAFEKCVRYTPCWVLTSSQISDYLPSEAGLFDLVVIDEASQSDITVLPGMLRGKQWLIVGDGKQVSPTESFISEAQIDSLKASLPESPLADSLLPGQSFFDLCAQAFPTGRVVLSEHFRCAPEIINFSNSQFYDGRLIPLRLPTSSERMSPSIVDVRVNGRKVGKVNETECDKIVSMIRDLVNRPSPFPRSIGVISLVGDEQSRLIRGRVLDAIGPAKCKEHNILVGDAPSFQGAERDVIFLSLVCSVGSVPTQSQQMHAQRANVALSRARDRMVLVRSIDSSHIPSRDDVKGPIIEFFQDSGTEDPETFEQVDEAAQKLRANNRNLLSFRDQAENVLEKMLTHRGFSVMRMGVVWNDGICVEDTSSATRAAVCVDCAGESKEEWKRVMAQQKSIERVGWRCLRVDALSVLMDCYAAFDTVLEFLSTAGVLPTVTGTLETSVMEEERDHRDVQPMDVEVDEDVQVVDDVEEVAAADRSSPSIVVISSDENENQDNHSPRRVAQPQVKVEAEDFDPGQFGDVVDLGFLVNEANEEEPLSVEQDERVEGNGNDGDANDSEGSERLPKRTRKRKSRTSDSDDVAYLGGTESEDEASTRSGRRSKRRRRYKKLDKYARDGRWYPGRNRSQDKLEEPWYDTDSDLAPDRIASSAASVDSLPLKSENS